VKKSKIAQRIQWTIPNKKELTAPQTASRLAFHVTTLSLLRRYGPVVYADIIDQARPETVCL